MGSLEDGGPTWPLRCTRSRAPIPSRSLPLRQPLPAPALHAPGTRSIPPLPPVAGRNPLSPEQLDLPNPQVSLMQLLRRQAEQLPPSRERPLATPDHAHRVLGVLPAPGNGSPTCGLGFAQSPRQRLPLLHPARTSCHHSWLPRHRSQSMVVQLRVPRPNKDQGASGN